MKWYKIIVVVVVLAMMVLSLLFYLNILLIEKYDFVAGVDKVVSISVEERLAEISMVQEFLMINIILSAVLLVLIIFAKFTDRKSIKNSKVLSRNM